MHFNTTGDHCTDSVALACIVNVFTACKTPTPLGYRLQFAEILFPAHSPNMMVISLIFIESTVELCLCWFSLKTYKMLATRNKESNSYLDSHPDVSLTLKSN